MNVFRMTCSLLLFAGSVVADGTAHPTITSTGEASRSVTPTVVAFEVVARFRGDSFTDAVAKGSDFSERFGALLKVENMSHGEMSFRAPVIDSLNSPSVLVHGVVEFPVPEAAVPSEQSDEFASLVDKMRDLTDTLGANLEASRLLVSDPELVEQETLKRATENALYKADAIAQVLGTQIYEVQQVKVLELKWNSLLDDIETFPGIDRITCSAKVSLTYLHQP